MDKTKFEFEIDIPENHSKHENFINAIKELSNRLTHISENVAYIFSNGCRLLSTGHVEHTLIAKFSIIYFANLEEMMFSAIKQNVRYIISKYDFPNKRVRVERSRIESGEFIV